VVRVTREHIANMMGLTRQSVHKILKRLESIGMLELNYGSVTITNPKRLEEYFKELEQ
ncbi:helix-turn-helix domain-containing protein, partial [Vibrio parahaemolyticus]|nr:helix-turn-helix domain-containing protein [Vibrio parahaemolyticus]